MIHKAQKMERKNENSRNCQEIERDLMIFLERGHKGDLKLIAIGAESI